jgi:hypothetical protein
MMLKTLKGFINMEDKKEDIRLIVKTYIEPQLFKKQFIGKYPNYYRIQDDTINFISFFLSKGKRRNSLLVRLGRFPKKRFKSPITIKEIIKRHSMNKKGELWGRLFWVDEIDGEAKLIYDYLEETCEKWWRYNLLSYPEIISTQRKEKNKNKKKR